MIRCRFRHGWATLSLSRLPRLAQQRLAWHLTAVNVAKHFDRNKLRFAGDEARYPARSSIADADPADPTLAPAVRLPRWQGGGLRICDVDDVVSIDVDIARWSELIPMVQEDTLLIEDLDPSKRRSATKIRPSESIAIAWGLFISPARSSLKIGCSWEPRQLSIPERSSTG